MPRPKKEPTYIKSIRVDSKIKEFLESLDNANEFVIQLIKENEEFKKFLRELEARNNKNQPSLFEDCN